jgi:hypothetical protein
MKYAIGIIILISISAGSYVGYNKYRDYKFLEDTRPFIKNSSLRLQNVLHYEIEDSESITFKELFEKLEESISETDKNILQVQTLSTPNQKSLSEPLENYLKCIQELERTILSKYRKILALSLSLDRLNESLEELKASSSYSFDIYKKSSDKALKEAEKSQAESKEALESVVVALKKLKALVVSLQENQETDSLVDMTTLDLALKKNTSSAESEKYKK